MEELKLKSMEIIKINKEKFIAQVVDGKTDIHKISKEEENLICNTMLELAYASELGFHHNCLGSNEKGEYYLKVYDLDTSKDEHYYLKYMRPIKNPFLYQLEDNHNYIIYANRDEGEYKLFTLNEGNIKEIKDIKENIVNGDFCNISSELKASTITQYEPEN